MRSGIHFQFKCGGVEGVFHPTITIFFQDLNVASRAGPKNYDDQRELSPETRMSFS